MKLKPFVAFASFALGSFVLTAAGAAKAYTYWARYPATMCVWGGSGYTYATCPFVSSNSFDSTQVSTIVAGFWNSGESADDAGVSLCNGTGRAPQIYQCSSPVWGTIPALGGADVTINDSTSLSYWQGTNASHYLEILATYNYDGYTQNGLIGYRVYGG